jgi:hypothetical protein
MKQWPVKFHPLGIVMEMPSPSRVLHHFVWNSEVDTPDNRKAAEDALREKGATLFEHVTAYSVYDDVAHLQTHGYVLETDPDAANVNGPNGHSLGEILAKRRGV